MEQGLDWISKELVGDNSSSTEDPGPGLEDPMPTLEDPFFRDSFFHPDLIPDSSPCKAVLHYHVGASSIRLWDLLLLLPNLAFLLLLFYRLPSARAWLRASSSNLHRCLYHLVLCFTQVLQVTIRLRPPNNPEPTGLSQSSSLTSGVTREFVTHWQFNDRLAVLFL